VGLRNFNLSKGIVHVFSPPYTQELNGLAIAERTIGTLVSMVPTNMIPA
jgi:hypothetical protein